MSSFKIGDASSRGLILSLLLPSFDDDDDDGVAFVAAEAGEGGAIPEEKAELVAVAVAAAEAFGRFVGLHIRGTENSSRKFGMSSYCCEG